jgi:DNA invertase Pin-like site-specific DNA recombinase
MKRKPAGDTKGMRCAIYARVSTERQKNDMQLTELRDYASRQGWETVEYLEKESSAKKRPVFDQLREDARNKRFDVVIVWKLDRAFRKISQLIEVIQEFDRFGIRFIATTMGIDTDNRSPMGKLIIHLFGVLAEFERDLLIERTKAGLAEARRQGHIGGRPGKVYRRDRAAELRRQGMSWRAISRELGIPQATIRKHLKGCA